MFRCFLLYVIPRAMAQAIGRSRGEKSSCGKKKWGKGEIVEKKEKTGKKKLTVPFPTITTCTWCDVECQEIT